MRVAVLGFLLGVMGLQLQAELPPTWWFALPGIPLALLWLFRDAVQGRIGRWLARFIVLACFAALGVAWAGWRAEDRLAEALPRDWEARDIELTGAIASLPQRNDRGVRFEFEVEQIATPGAVVPGHLSLAWYDENNRKTGEVTRAPAVEPGERWTLTLRLKRPHGTMNPHAFDFEAWALERSIRATGYVRQKGVNEKQAQAASGLGYSIDRLRLRIRDAMNASLEGKPYAGVLVALTIGQQNAISADQWRDFWRTGTGHLISVNGPIKPKLI